MDITHPRRPRGGQSGREKRRDQSFQAQTEKPLGTDSHRTISKRSRDEADESKNVSDAVSRSNLICTEKIVFLTDHNLS